jgi:hypothetical protein
MRLRTLTMAAYLLAVSNLIGCHDPLTEMGNMLDEMSNKEAEYGTMAISSPVLSPPSPDFAFNLTADQDQFFKDAQSSIQGSASVFQQSVLSSGVGVNATFNPASGAAYLAQLQQYQRAVTNDNNAQAITNLQVSLNNSAAYADYQADIKAAYAETDPATRAQDIATAKQKLAASLQAPQTVTPPAFPTAPSATVTGSVAGRPTDVLSQFANGGNFAGFQGLSSSPATLSVSDRTAILTAAGDNATKAIFQLLGDPALVDQFKDKRILFGVVTVSVEPGWRTQKDFAADVSASLCCEYKPARPSVIEEYIKDPRAPKQLRQWIREWYKSNQSPSNEHCLDLPSQFKLDPQYASVPFYGFGPHVAVVSPLTGTQTLDLASSDRRERDVSVSLDIAAQLAALGLGGESQSFLKYAQSLQQDVATLSPDVVVNSYSSGSTFGFQVGPQLRAVEQAQERASGPAEVLDRQSFPALVIFGLESDGLYPRVIWNDEKKRYDLYEPRLVMQSMNRWVPARAIDDEEHFWGTQWLEDFFVRDRQSYPSETDVLDLSDKADKELDQVIKENPDAQSGEPNFNAEAYWQDKVDSDRDSLNQKQSAFDAMQAGGNSRNKSEGDETVSGKGDELKRLQANEALIKAKEQLQVDNAHLDAAKLQTESEEPADGVVSHNTMAVLQNRLIDLRTKLFGCQSFTFLPADYIRLGGNPRVCDIQPASVRYGEMETVAVIGQNLDYVDRTKIRVVNGDVAQAEAAAQPPFHAKFQDGALLLQFTPEQEANSSPNQKIIFALPSIADPDAVVYTPPVAVIAGDPSDLAIAPQTILLQASPAAAGGGGGASSQAGGSAGGAASTTPSPGTSGTAAAASQTVTVLIVGNNLNEIDVGKITAVPSTIEVQSQQLVGNAISFKITVSAPAPAIYFELPIAGTCPVRQIVSPPITIQAAQSTANGGTQPIGGAPQVTGISQITEAPLNSTIQATLLITGNNLTGIDLGNPLNVVWAGPASTNTTSSAKLLANGDIEVTVTEPPGNPGGPFTIGLPSVGGKFPLVSTPQFSITLVQ